MRAIRFETYPAVADLAAADTKNDQTAASGYSDLQPVGAQASTRPSEIRGPLALCLLAGFDFIILTLVASAINEPASAITWDLGNPRGIFSASLLTPLLFIILFDRLGGYKGPRLLHLRSLFMHVFLVWGGAILAVALLGAPAKSVYHGVAVWVVGAVCLSGQRYLIHRSRLCYTLSLRRIAILGSEKESTCLATRLMGCKDIIVTGVLYDEALSDHPVTIPNRVPPFLRRYGVDEVIIAVPSIETEWLKCLRDQWKSMAIDVSLWIETGGEIRSRAGLSTEIPVFKLIERPLKDWRAVAKWAEDKVLATILILVTAPLMFFIAIVIKMDSRGPVLFIQDRFGLNNSVIRVFKFRTMHAQLSDPSG